MTEEAPGVHFLSTLFGEDFPGHLILFAARDGRGHVVESFESIGPGLEQAIPRLAKSYNVYFALGLQAEAPPKGCRGTAKTVVAVPGFWVDIDKKGPGHKSDRLPGSAEEALDELGKLGLPDPTMVVDSGGGLHVYWLFRELLEVREGLPDRKVFGQTLNALQGHIRRAWAKRWDVDHTSDLARVLRVPGTINRKVIEEPRPVTLIEEHPDKRYNLSDFEFLLPASLGEPKAKRPHSSGETWSGGDADLDKILKGCSWMRHVQDDAANLSEPEWYAAQSIVGRCKNGRERAHELSKPYPGYSASETNKKLDQALKAAGPRSCRDIEEKFGDEWCKGCRHHDTISSPISLGSDGEKQRSDQSTNGATLKAAGIVRLALAEKIELFHSSDRIAFASVPQGESQETLALKGKEFAAWLSRRLYKETGGVPSATTLDNAIRVLEGRALFDGPKKSVFVRTAEHGGKIYIDLANEAREVVEVDSEGWRLITEFPIKFLRRSGMLALPRPTEGGRLGDIFQFVNIPDPEAQILYLAWLVGAIKPGGPYPILAVIGEQGSAKSTTCRNTRNLIDPNKAPLIRPPGSAQDFALMGFNRHVVALTNITKILGRLSDDLCSLATGGGFGTRRLFSDDEEVVFNLVKPVVMEGIHEFVHAPDLLDRIIRLDLPSIPSSDRRNERLLDAEFSAAHPGILGALLDVAVTGLRELPHTKPDELPRMADFATWVIACESALPWSSGEFLRVYTEAREGTHDSVIENSPFAKCLLELLGRRREGDAAEWAGSFTDLLGELEAVFLEPHWVKGPAKDVKDVQNRSFAPQLYSHGGLKHPKHPKDLSLFLNREVEKGGWPASPRGASSFLRSLEPALRAYGVSVRRREGQDSRRRGILHILQSFAAPDAEGFECEGSQELDPSLPPEILHPSESGPPLQGFGSLQYDDDETGRGAR